MNLQNPPKIKRLTPAEIHMIKITLEAVADVEGWCSEKSSIDHDEELGYKRDARGRLCPSPLLREIIEQLRRKYAY